MEIGQIHIYTGDGKGKTTASIGLAVRMNGAGKKVLFAQFMKGMYTSEIASLKRLGIEILRKETINKFVFSMNEEEKKQYKEENQSAFNYIKENCRKYDLIVLDEAISAITTEMLEESEMIYFLKNKPEELEVVLTGRNPSEALMECADYLSEIAMHKHPYEKGIKARVGIEF